jgi:hypothetical protein
MQGFRELSTIPGVSRFRRSNWIFVAAPKSPSPQASSITGSSRPMRMAFLPLRISSIHAGASRRHSDFMSATVYGIGSVKQIGRPRSELKGGRFSLDVQFALLSDG